MTDVPADIQMTQSAVRAAMTIVRAVPMDDVEAWAAYAREEHGRYDTLGPMIDPTGWIRDHEQAHVGYELIEAFLEFRRMIEGAREVLGA